MRYEWIILDALTWIMSRGGSRVGARLGPVFGVGAGIPGRRGDFADRTCHADAEFDPRCGFAVLLCCHLSCHPHDLWPKTFENHLVSPACRPLPIFLTAYG